MFALSRLTRIVPHTLVAAVTALTLVACAASKEDRVKGWTNAQAKADSLIKLHPNFKSVIELKKKDATAAWAKAEKVSDEKEQVEAMGTAITTLSKLTNRIAEVDSKLEGLNEDITKLSKMKILVKNKQRRLDGLNDAYEATSKVNNAMTSAKPTTEEEAMGILDEQVGILISAQGAVDRTIRAVEIKKAKKTKKRKKK